MNVYCKLRDARCVWMECLAAGMCAHPPTPDKNQSYVEADGTRKPLIPIATGILSELSSILSQRGDSYADIADNSEVFTRLMTALGVTLPDGMTPVQFHCMSNICTKLARFATGDRGHEDTYLDIANYATLIAAHHRREKK